MSNSNNLCPICGEGNLCPQVTKNPVEYKGQMTELDLHYSRCEVCDSEQADAAKTRMNKRLMNAFKKRVDGLLTGAEVRALREKLALTQVAAAQVFGGGPVAFSKYESDDVAQSEAMDKLLRLTAELPAAFELLCRRAGIEQVLTGKNWHSTEGWLAEPRHPEESRRPKLRLVSSATPSADQHARYAA